MAIQYDADGNPWWWNADDAAGQPTQSGGTYGSPAGAPATTPAPGTTTPPPTTGGGGGGGGGNGQLYGDINNVPNAPDYSFFESAPAFDAPTFSYRPWQAPTGESVLSDPGYQFRLQQGEGALQAAAAAKGIGRTGGALKDILGWGQQFASQEYQNVYNRQRNDYDTGFNQAYQAYQGNYNAAKDAYAPKMTTWESKMNLGQRAADLGWGRAWDKYTYTHPSGSDIYRGGQ